MKLKCIDNYFVEKFLTENKFYQIFDKSACYTYYVLDDTNEMNWYDKRRFSNREEKLKRILNV